MIGLAEGTSLLRGGDGYHAAADMWAFGVVLSRMITGCGCAQLCAVRSCVRL